MSAVTKARPVSPTSACWCCRTPLRFIGAVVRYIAGLGLECAYCGYQMEVASDVSGRRQIAIQDGAR